MRIVFGPNAKQSDVTEHSKEVLTDICAACKVDSVTVSSTQRDPFNQARVMYANIVSQGVAAQKKLYREPGQMVINAFVEAKSKGKTKDEIIKAMEAKIIEIGPSKVSRHAANPKILNVFDIAPSSIPSSKRSAFEKAVRAESRVSKFLTPPNDPGYHLEIPQPEHGDENEGGSGIPCDHNCTD
jgi:hypothetical protein